jgi:DNA-binding MarR family transcriptional regulator
MNATVQKFDDCVIFLLAKAYQKAHANFKKRLIGYGLTPIQHLILEALWLQDGQSAGDIGKMLTLDAATLSGVLERLAAGEWITKEPDPDDKRILRIHLTSKCKELRPRLSEERNRANDEIMHKLTLEEKILLKRLLRDVQA